MTALLTRINQYIQNNARRTLNDQLVVRLTHQVHARTGMKPQTKAPGTGGDNPVAFFNASTRLVGMSLNAAFSLLASLGLQVADVPVVRFTCRAGMALCVLGTDRTHPSKSPPCRRCISQSRTLSSDAPNTWFAYTPDSSLIESLAGLTLEHLCSYDAPLAWQVPGVSGGSIPLGQLVLPSVRWVLRLHHLQDDDPTRHIYRQYILSAYNVAKQFSAFLDATNPRAVVLFNGQFFPEATARWICLQRGLPAITHEVGLLPYSGFFTPGEATAYPLHIPGDFELSPAQDKQLDEYLSQRFQGQFSMAGVRFWPEMKGLDESLLQRIASFKQVVPIFTNVIFDTSQPHSNVIFPHMFSWLDLVLEIVRQHPETLFVLRAHPDETRPGKASRESVRMWVQRNLADSLPNLVFVDSNQSFSSYELIQRSKFVMVYNSTIGLEASILGVPVLCAGRARYTQLPTVFFPSTQEEYRQVLESFLTTGNISIPGEFKRNARRFLYFQLFRSSLPFGEFLEEDGIWPGFVKLKQFSLHQLSTDASPAIRAIVNGIGEPGDFLLDAPAFQI